MLKVTDKAQEKLREMIEVEKRTYSDSDSQVLEKFVFSIVLYTSQNDKLCWELFATAASKDMPEESFLVVNGIMFHDPSIRTIEAKVDYVAGNFFVNGQHVRLLSRQSKHGKLD